MQHAQQFSVLDKFLQDFRNNQILWKYDKKVCQQPQPQPQQQKQQQQPSHS